MPIRGTRLCFSVAMDTVIQISARALGSVNLEQSQLRARAPVLVATYNTCIHCMSAPPLKLSASSSLQLGGDGQTDGASQIMGRTPKEAGSVSSRNGPVQLARTARETSGPSRSSSTGSAPPKQRPHQTPSTRIALRAATNSKSVALHVRGSGSHTTKPPPRNRQSTASLSQTSLAQTSSAEDLPPSAEMQPGGGKSGGGGLGRRGSSELTEEGAGIGSSRSFKSAAMSKLEREIEVKGVMNV